MRLAMRRTLSVKRRNTGSDVPRLRSSQRQALLDGVEELFVVDGILARPAHGNLHARKCASTVTHAMYGL